MSSGFSTALLYIWACRMMLMHRNVTLLTGHMQTCTLQFWGTVFSTTLWYSLYPGGCAANYTHSMFEADDIDDPGYIGTSLQRQFSKGLSEMLKGGSSSDTEAMQV
jgi:hypothetical protein